MTHRFGSYKMGKLRGLRLKGRSSAVQPSQSSRKGQYKMCVQYDSEGTVQNVCTVRFQVYLNLQ